MNILYVGLGGFIGASLRYLVSTWFAKIMGTQFPYGTLVVNIVGAFLIGFIMELSLNTDLVTPESRLFLTTGIMGGLTTFSTFSYETMNMIGEGSYFLGSMNIMLNLSLSVLGVIIGKYVSNLIL